MTVKVGSMRDERVVRLLEAGFVALVGLALLSPLLRGVDVKLRLCDNKHRRTCVVYRTAATTGD